MHGSALSDLYNLEKYIPEMVAIGLGRAGSFAYTSLLMGIWYAKQS